MDRLKKIRLLLLYIYRSTIETIKLNHSWGTKPIIVRVQFPIKFRFFYRLIFLLHKDNYAVYIYLPTLKTHFELAKMNGSLDLLPPVKLISRLPEWVDQATYCSDSDDKYWNLGWKKKIFLEFDSQKSLSDIINPIYIPFSVHDYIHRGFLKDRAYLLKNSKNIRMLFAGAFHGYKGTNISKILGKMEREEVVQIYRDYPNVVAIETLAQLDEILTIPPTNRFYWVDTDVFRIPPSRWLEVLSHVEVFLCPPGVVNPMSYNSNEAIAMGAIPLINYPEWFHPTLEDQKNCFVFSNQQDLIEKLDYISKLSQEQLNSIRSNLATYFIQFQSDEAVLKKINEYENVSVVTFIMNVEQEICKTIQPTALAADIDKK